MAALGLALTLSAGVLFSGCNTSPNTMVGQSGQGGLNAYVNIANRSLQKDITLVNALSKETNGFLVAAVTLKSHVKSTQEFEYKFQWFDANGLEIRDVKTHWQLDRIFGYEEKQLQGIAPTELAATFKLMIREPQPVTR
ncbi:MAG: YcfL family protein [Candidatus Sumerlaeota bacterium]|nr:YcfL family protein [Candidatus Sumerlaeota bacterium]